AYSLHPGPQACPTRRPSDLNVLRGVFQLRALASDNWHGSNSSAVVTISVSNTPPSVALTAPANGAVFFEGTNVTLSALATDVDGTLRRTELQAGTNSLGLLA